MVQRGELAEAAGVRRRRGRPRSSHLLLLLDAELLELRDAEAALRDLLGLVLPRRTRHAGGRNAGAGAGDAVAVAASAAVLGQLLLQVVVVVGVLLHHLSAVALARQINRT
jgi:hypothetical protein